MPDLVQNHSIRELNPSSTITSPMQIDHRIDHNSASGSERDCSYRHHEVDQLIRRPEESYSDVSHRQRLDMLGQHDPSGHLHPHPGKIKHFLYYSML